MALFSRRKPPLQVGYIARSTDHKPDQAVTLRNDTEALLRPVLSFQAVNPYGIPLPHVEVGTVVGIDRGVLACPPGTEIVDVLHFHGQGARQVRGVLTQVVALHEEVFEGLTSLPEAVMVDLEQHQTLDPSEFWGVGLVNRNDVPVSVGVTLVEYEERQKDTPRQATDAVTLEGSVDLASQSHDVLWLPEDVRGRFHGVFVHVVHPWSGAGELPPPPEPTG